MTSGAAGTRVQAAPEEARATAATAPVATVPGLTPGLVRAQAAEVLRLQRAAGNAATRRIMSRLQSRRRLARDEWGTAKTTAPVASQSPHKQWLGELKDELQLFANAAAVAAWLKKKMGDEALTTSFDFSPADIVGDKATAKKLKPAASSADGLADTLKLMAFYGAITIKDGKHTANVSNSQLDTGKLDAAAKKVAGFTAEFEKRWPKEGGKKAIVVTDLMDQGLSSDRTQMKAEQEQQSKVDHLRDDIEALKDSTDPKDVKQREALQKQLQSAEKNLASKQNYRRFSLEVLSVLRPLAQRNKTFKAGTYPSHSWGEFSIDIFLTVGMSKEAPGFWNRDAVRTFFDDLNAVCEDSTKTWGKYAWRAIYNDDPLRAEINKKYGEKRVINVPGHGPDKLHIHLDLRPINVVKDVATGFDMDSGSGRVVIND